MTDSGPRVVVIGAGIIGQSTAYYLAHAGAAVTLMDSDDGPSPTSRSSLGVLTHAYGADDAYSSFYRDCHALHEPLSALLLQETGIDVGWRPLGGIDLAFDEGEAGTLRDWVDLNLSRGAEAEWLDESTLREAEPGLTTAALGGARFVQDGRVDPVRLGTALRVAAQKRGTVVRTSTTVTEIRPLDGGVDCHLAMASGECTESYDVAVVTTGAWTGELAPSVRVRPIRGQSGFFSGVHVRHVLRWGGLHALPDGDDTLVGGTVDEVGFDLTTTDAARQELMAWSGRLFDPAPSLRQLRAGLRPKPRRGRPVITPLETGTLFVATGHYKSGILMGPHTGQVVARWIMEGSPGRDMSPFTIAR